MPEIGKRGKAIVRPALKTAGVIAVLLLLSLASTRIAMQSIRMARHSRSVVSRRLEQRGNATFVAILDAERPTDAVSGLPIDVQGAPRVSTPHGSGRRVTDDGTSHIIPAPSRKGTFQATYAISMAPDDTVRKQEILNQSSKSAGICLYLEGGKLLARFRNGAEETMLEAQYAGAAGAFTYVAVTVSESEAAIYQNGRKSASIDLPWKVSLLPRPWEFDNASRNPFLGVVDAMAIWDRALPPGEIAHISHFKGNLARRIEPASYFAAACAKRLDSAIRCVFRVFDRLVPSRSGIAAMSPDIPSLTLRMDKNDERHFSRAHEKALFNGYRPKKAARPRSFKAVFKGGIIPLEACLDDAYSCAEPAKRPAFILCGEPGGLLGPDGVARLYPPELHTAFHEDAPDIFPANPNVVRLYEDSLFRGLYIVEPLGSPGSAWMERGERNGIALYSNGAPKRQDVLTRGEDRAAVFRRHSSLFASDDLFPWSTPEIAAREKLWLRHQEFAAARPMADPVISVFAILGENRSPMFICSDLDLSADGVEWESSDTDVISDGGAVRRPDGDIPRIVTLSATDASSGARQEYRLRVMPTRQRLPALFLGIASPVNKTRKSDFVATLVRDESLGPAITTHGLVGEGGGIRHRGNSSYVKGVKRSLALEFSVPFPWPDPKSGREHLLLHSGYSDPTRLRNKLSFDFFHAAAKLVGGPVQPAPHFTWLELFVNGEYFGVWETSERIRDTIPAGWPLFKVRGLNSWLWAKADTSILDCVTAAPGDEAAYAPIEEAFRFVAESPNEQFISEADSRFDLGNLVCCYLLLNFSENTDAVFMNQYFATDPASGRTMVIPWDYDKTFLGIGRPLLANRLYFRLIRQRPDFFKRACWLWRELREGDFSDAAIDARIEDYAAFLAPFMEEEWALLAPAGVEGGIRDTIEELKAAARKRTAFLDKMLVPPDQGKAQP